MRTQRLLRSSLILFLLSFLSFGVFAQTTNLQGNWVLGTIYGDKVTATEGEKPGLQIYVKEKRFTGFGGCNRISGKLTTIVENALVFGPITATKMNCEETSDMESDFLAAIAEVQTWERSGPKLKLRDVSGDVILEFTQNEE